MQRTFSLVLAAPFLLSFGGFAGEPSTHFDATPGPAVPNVDDVLTMVPIITLEVSPDLGDLGYDWESTHSFETHAQHFFLRHSSLGAGFDHAVLRVFDGADSPESDPPLQVTPINPAQSFRVFQLGALPVRDTYKIEIHPTHADGTPKWTPSNWVLLTKAGPAEPIPFLFGGINAETIRDDWGVPALSGAASCHPGHAVEFVAGVRRDGDSVKAQPGDLWHIGSDTKAMTATMIGLLVERGLLDWDDTVWELVWDRNLFPELQTWPGWGGVHWRFTGVTIEHLASHRSGMVMTASEDDPTRLLDNYMEDPTTFRWQTVQSLLSRDHTGIIGEWRYGHGNYMLLGVIIERIMGKPYERVMREELFLPIGMHSARFGMPTDRALPFNLPPHPDKANHTPSTSTNPWVVDPYAARDVDTTAHVNGHLYPSETLDVDNIALPPVWNPAGGIYLSHADWLKFLRLHIDGRAGGLVMQQATLDRLHTPYMRPDRMAGPWEADPADRSDPSYGFGWGIWGGPTDRTLGHDGTYFRFYASCRVYLDRGHAVTSAANVQGGKGAFYGDNACGSLRDWLAAQAQLCPDPPRLGIVPRPLRDLRLPGDDDIVLIPRVPEFGPGPVIGDLPPLRLKAPAIGGREAGREALASPIRIETVAAARVETGDLLGLLPGFMPERW